MEHRPVSVELLSAAETPREAVLFFRQDPRGIFPLDGRLYLRLGAETASCEDSPEGRKLLQALSRREPSFSRNSREEGLYRLLTLPPEKLCPGELHGLPLSEGRPRCVLLFQSLTPRDLPLPASFAAMAPLEEGDLAVPLGEDAVALIKDCALQGEEEIAEYAAAVLETMEGEGIPGLRVGIGRCVKAVSDLHGGYLEAAAALRLGLRFQSGETVYTYRALALERILNLIPPDGLQALRRDFFPKASPDSFSPEMMETVRTFFQNDLNLTATARQLFVHRNTLNYRLDKIRKDTGLDLRRFQDAVIFRILSALPADPDSTEKEL